MRLALAVASAIVLVVHGVVFYDQFFHRWERHQTAYFEQARTRSTSDAEKAELGSRRPAIEQIIVTQFGDSRVDRCTTCHIAADDPRFADHFQPIKSHPYSPALGDTTRDGRQARRHKFADFGCTVCHEGQGRGLEAEYAHGEDEYWPEPLAGFVTQANWKPEYREALKGREYMEANCAQCHTDEAFPGTPRVNRGRELFFEKNCYGCHRIEGLSDGALGPDLSEVGRKFKVDYLYESIVAPRANLATSFMPQFTLSSEETKDLVIFLKSRRGMNFNETSIERYRAKLEAPAAPSAVLPAAAAAPAAQGALLVRRRACAACHKIGADDGGIAPDLSYTGLTRDPAWVFDHFKNPRAVVPDSIMPAFRFSDEEFKVMGAYLMSLTAPPPPQPPAQDYQQLCARCHGAQGRGDGPIAPYVDPAPRDLTKTAFMTTKPMARFVQSVTDGVGGTSMAAWGRVLGEARVRALVDYIFTAEVKEPIRTLKPRTVPAANPVAPSPASAAEGERIFVQRCAGCHGRKADGKGPNSTDIVPRPRNLRNSPFMAQVSDQRLFESILYGVQGTAMPPWIDYGLNQQDVGNIVNFMRSINTRR